jgi:hypothetical protein
MKKVIPLLIALLVPLGAANAEDLLGVTPGSGSNIGGKLATGGGFHPGNMACDATDPRNCAPVDATKGITVQGAAGGTAVPISAASLPLPSTAATSTKQSDGSQKTQIVDGSGNVIGSSSNNLNVNCASGCSSLAAVAPTTSNGGTSLVLKASAGTLYAFHADNYSSTSGFIIAYNATAAPSPGALTAGAVLACLPLPPNTSTTFSYGGGPPGTFSTGIVILLSSGANCVTYTTGTITGYIAGQAT